MKAILLVLVVLFTSNQTPALAAPSIEACPFDSVISEDVCKCDLATCKKPPCPTELQIATNGSNVPGKCCPTYECVGCKDDEKIHGMCPCANGAIIEEYKCECVDEQKHLVDGECVCNPQLCPLPELCDRKSVAVTVTEGCCKKTICTPCPSDSESTNVEGDEIEDHCVCLPCKAECGYNRTVVIKKHGSGFPGSCCDLYECKKPEKINGCLYLNEWYEDGKKWYTPDLQLCECNNGLALCSSQKEKEATSCFVDNKLYKDSEKWYKEEGCTTCVCENGLPKCISHYCSVKETFVQINHSCIRNDKVYRNSSSWIEKDGCTNCTCINGNEICNNYLCDTLSTTAKISECQPLANCNKTCPNGFKVNRKGCEICKCGIVKMNQDILTRYNISMNDLINILDDYKAKRLSTTSATTGINPGTTSSASITTTTTDKTANIDHENNPIPVVIMNRNAEIFEDTSTSTTTEPSVKPTDHETDSLIYILIAVISSIIAVSVLGILCFFKNRRKSSLDLSHCHYQTVNTHNNNNTIKKTELL